MREHRDLWLTLLFVAGLSFMAMYSEHPGMQFHGVTIAHVGVTVALASAFTLYILPRIVQWRRGQR